MLIKSLNDNTELNNNFYFHVEFIAEDNCYLWSFGNKSLNEEVGGYLDCIDEVNSLMTRFMQHENKEKLMKSEWGKILEEVLIG